MSFILILFTLMTGAKPAAMPSPLATPVESRAGATSPASEPNIASYDDHFCSIPKPYCQHVGMWLHEGVLAKIQPVLISPQPYPSEVDRDWQAFYDQMPANIRPYVLKAKRIVVTPSMLFNESDLPASWNLDAVAEAIGTFDEFTLPLVYWDGDIGYNDRLDHEHRIWYRFHSGVLQNDDLGARQNGKTETTFMSWLLFTHR